METAVASPDLRIRFGRATSTCREDEAGLSLDVRTPLLGGPAEEFLFQGKGADDIEIGGSGEIRWIQSPSQGLIAGAAVRPISGSPEQAAFDLYREILEITGSHSLYRVWNFLPQINAETGGIENYRSFNIGRWRAFAEHFGESGMEPHLPTASAVGTEDDCLTLAFLAGKSPVAFFENPQQVPAYRYPAEYGPRSPSFARGAVVVENDSGQRTSYLSGTSAIRGHETIGTGDLDTQFDATIENIRAILETMGFGSAFESDSPVESSFRVYLRDANDFERIRERFAEVVGADAIEKTIFLNADICRAPLKLEIEGVFCEGE